MLREFTSLENEFRESINKLQKGIWNSEISLSSVKNSFDGIQCLVQEMAAKIDQVPPQYSHLRLRFESYLRELNTLEQEFKRKRVLDPSSDSRTLSLLGETKIMVHDTILKQNSIISESERLIADSEEMGGQILLNLAKQKESMRNASDVARDSYQQTTRARRLLTQMGKALRNRNVLILVIMLILVLVILILLYLKVLKPLLRS